MRRHRAGRRREEHYNEGSNMFSANFRQAFLTRDMASRTGRQRESRFSARRREHRVINVHRRSPTRHNGWRRRMRLVLIIIVTFGPQMNRDANNRTHRRCRPNMGRNRAVGTRRQHGIRDTHLTSGPRQGRHHIGPGGQRHDIRRVVTSPHGKRRRGRRHRTSSRRQ